MTGRFDRKRAVLLAALGLACNLESALGVDDSGMPMDAESSSDDGASPSEEGADTIDPASTSQSTGLGGSATGDTEPDPPMTSCADRSLRLATFNVKSVGVSGTASHDALAAVLRRIDADIVCLQEVEIWETSDLFALASASDYPDVIQASAPPAIGGDLTNACLSRLSLSLVGSYTGDELSSDPAANDVGRDILVVEAALGQPGEPECHLGLVALHLKSGQEPLDWFRRQVETERVRQAVERYRLERPDAPMVILGDLNETLDDPALGHVFEAIPPGLPPSYRVGMDINFPLTYQPFARFESLGFTRAHATQEDSNSRDETWNDVVRLDYLLYAGADLVNDEVYNACRDNGVDDEPTGNWMAKTGAPLECSVSEVASDHFPVVADLQLR